MLRRRVLAIIGVGIFLLLWDTISRYQLLSDAFFPSVGGVVLAAWDHRTNLLAAICITARDIAIGFVAGSSLAVVFGILIGYYRSLHSMLNSILLLFSPIPIVTFLPLFILWFGLNVVPVLVCAGIAAFFPSLMSTVSGVRNVDVELVEAVRNLGASERQIVRYVILPGSLPHIATGLRHSIQLCFLVTPVAEMIMGDIGLGGFIWRSADLFRVDAVVLGQVTLGLMGLTIYRLFDFLEDRIFLRWRR